jgi:hypothetical protein
MSRPVQAHYALSNTGESQGSRIRNNSHSLSYKGAFVSHYRA